MTEGTDDNRVDTAGTVDHALQRWFQRLFSETEESLSRMGAAERGSLNVHRAVEMAKRQMASPEPSRGFIRLWEMGKLDLSVEDLVARPEFAQLFTAEERSIARARLVDRGYDV